MRENVIQQKSYQFALKTIKLCRLLRDSNICPAIDLNEIIQDSEELKKILHSIVKSSRQNL